MWQTILLFVLVSLVLCCHGANLDFVPIFKASALPKVGTVAKWSSKCFTDTNATVTQVSDTQLVFVMYASKPSSKLCKDLYLFATQENYHIHQVFFHGSHKITINFKNQAELKDILTNGIFIFEIKDGILGSLRDLWKFLGLIRGKHQFQNNVEFIEKNMNITFKEQSQAAQHLNISESDIESGDQFAVLNFAEGLPLILLGTGGLTDHTAVALRIDGELFVTESSGLKLVHGRTGVIRTPWKQWLEDVKRTRLMVNLLKLSPESRAKFNESAAIEFFKKNEGNPYGFKSFIFGWVDTEFDNFPPPLSVEVFSVGIALLSHLQPKAAHEYILSAFSMRLLGKETNATFEELMQIADSKNKTFGQLLAMPEQDEWRYSDGPSMVCNVFVMSMYKAAGLFPGLNIQATETTPRDVYQLDLYDKTGQLKPQWCKGIDNNEPFCQITGQYKLPLPGYSTIKPYDFMFEKCGALPPSYQRFPANC